VSERAIAESQRLLARVEGIWTAPEAAALVAALSQLQDTGQVTRDAEVVLVLTGAGIKNEPPALPPPIDLSGADDEVAARVREVLTR
jgi:threonine synthase